MAIGVGNPLQDNAQANEGQREEVLDPVLILDIMTVSTLSANPQEPLGGLIDHLIYCSIRGWLGLNNVSANLLDPRENLLFCSDHREIGCRRNTRQPWGASSVEFLARFDMFGLARLAFNSTAKSVNLLRENLS